MELVGSELAAHLGLFVPDFAVLDLQEIEVPMQGCAPMTFGPAFISRESRCISSDGSSELVARLAHPEELATLVMLDTWIRNLDRCPPWDYIDPEPRRDNLCFTPKGLKLKLMVIDHSHCFVEEGLEDGLHGDQFVNDDRIYGRFPEFEPYLRESALRQAADAVRSIDQATVAEIVHSVPGAWGPSEGTRRVWIDRIVARQARVPKVVISAIVPQAQMDV